MRGKLYTDITDAAITPVFREDAANAKGEEGEDVGKG